MHEETFLPSNYVKALTQTEKQVQILVAVHQTKRILDFALELPPDNLESADEEEEEEVDPQNDAEDFRNLLLYIDSFKYITDDVKNNQHQPVSYQCFNEEISYWITFGLGQRK
ncbi:hypothetical protein A0J61_01958 [Choanephora cucurbitarum]|uniref:Uncharacterized protein n=1 Tax=Choanephora cucurbitarum TaxID=101091 RepID=A0A1C7NLQ8_9FUNG|nr:hypothetical protein A0J61_01958 [Choanephora cucurbitarum]